MDEKMFTEKLKEIEMSQEMQERIIRNCYTQMEENTMKKNTIKDYFKKPMVAVASLALCLCLTGVTALAATGKLQGFFKDIKRWDGAITGTSYEQATDEMELNAATISDELVVTVTMLYPGMVPYAVLETLGVESYRIVDMTGNVIAEGTTTTMAEVVTGQVNINISLENISSGEYKLIVDKLVGGAKAEQPLVISGTWECLFEK